MFANLMTLMTLKTLTNDRRGIAAIEYALIAALMCVILIGVFPLLGTALTTGMTLIARHVATGT